MRAAVLGAGSWGTALGALLASKGMAVRIWDVDPTPLTSITERHENERYLPGVALPESLTAVAGLGDAVRDAELVVLAVPSTVMRIVGEQVRDHLAPGALVCSATKGIELDTLMTMSEVLEDVLPRTHHDHLAFLSGPSFAGEVAARLQTAVTVASRTKAVAVQVQQAFHTPWFRPYTSTDVVGVEIGGCTKNVIAIATGLADGLGFDANARAALITRGLVEISRLGIERGAEPATMTGLSCLGDLVLTCSSAKSRNYRVGFGLGQGRTLDDIQAELQQVAEGVVNAKSVHQLAEREGVEMPISNAIYRLLYEGLSPAGVLQTLTARDLKHEG